MKSRNFQNDRKPYILGCVACPECPEGRQRKVGKGRNFQCPNTTFCSLCPYYNKISLADKSMHHHAPMPWQFRSRSNKTKILPPLRQMELEWKSVKTNPKTLPPKWIVHFFISMPHITSLPEKHGSHSAEPACSPLERCACMLSHVWLSATLWTAACQAPLSMGFSRQEY